jgi:hypothetical protein
MTSFSTMQGTQNFELLLSLNSPLSASLFLQYLYSDTIDFRCHQDESEMISACLDLSSLARAHNIQGLLLYMTGYIIRRVNLRTIGKIVEYYKDAGIEQGVMQNAHRSTKKWIAINLDYY